MQELIERLAEKQSMWDKKSKEHIDIANTYYVAIIMAKKLLEKEKEQIIDTFNYGYYCASSGTDTEFELKGSSYYNKTYNQKT